jgi:hypothetical protein
MKMHTSWNITDPIVDCYLLTQNSTWIHLNMWVKNSNQCMFTASLIVQVAYISCWEENLQLKVALKLTGTI